MLKKVKKFTSLLLIAALILVFFIPSSADASIIGGNTGGGVIPPEDSVVHMYQASQVPAGLLNELIDMGVTINAGSVLHVGQFAKNSDATVLQVTNTNGNLVTTDCLLAYNDDGEIEDVVKEDGYGLTVYEEYDSYIPLTMTLVRAVAAYYSRDLDQFIGRGYQPQSLEVTYVDDSRDVSIFNVNYKCTGVLYSYPGLTMISEDRTDLRTHTINVSQSNPEVNTPYSTFNPISGARIIYTNQGAIGYHAITFTMYIDGQRVNNDISIIDDAILGDY